MTQQAGKAVAFPPSAKKSASTFVDSSNAAAWLNALFSFLQGVENSVSSQFVGHVVAADRRGRALARVHLRQGKIFQLSHCLQPEELRSKTPQFGKSFAPPANALFDRLESTATVQRWNIYQQRARQAGFSQQEAAECWGLWLARQMMTLCLHAETQLSLRPIQQSDAVPGHGLSPVEIFLAAAKTIDTLPSDSAGAMYQQHTQATDGVWAEFVDYQEAALLLLRAPETKFPIPVALRGFGQSLTIEQLLQVVKASQSCFSCLPLRESLNTLTLINMREGSWIGYQGTHRICLLRIRNPEVPDSNPAAKER